MTKIDILNYIKNNPKGFQVSLKKEKKLVELLSDYNFKTFSEKLYWYIYDIKDFPKCKTCGKQIKKYRSIFKGYALHCGCSCAQLDKETQKKLAETNLKKYGTVNPAQSKVVQDKMKKTNLERYGTENVFASEYGKKKIKKTNLERYGTENPQQNKIIKKKTIDTTMKRYGVKCPCLLNKDYNVSKGEIELFEFIKSHYSVIHNDREQISPMELDIYIPSLNIGIEYDGDYWHSFPDMIKRDKLKDSICKKKGIFLIRVKESDWIKNNANEKLRVLRSINGKKIS